MMIVFFHAWLLFPSMVIDWFPSKQAGIAGMTVFFLSCGVSHGRKGGATKKKSHQKNGLLLFFLVVGDNAA